MRKQLLLMLILCLSATMVWAERIDVSTARKVAENVANAGSGLRSAGDLSLVYAAAPGKSGSALRSGTVDGAADYFVFNVSGNKGFVIVSGEDRALPVFGYSDEGAFDPDNLPDNLRYMLAYYQNQITWLERSGIEVTADIQAEWSHYLNGTNFRSTAQEVVLETAEWDQGKPYNGMTPLISGEHALTGCVATAQAIIMRYHQYPVRAIGGVSSYDGVSTTYDDYDWANMPLTYPRDGYGDARDNAVAKLMWHCGANVEMSYGLSASGASMKLPAKSYVEVFGYSPAIRYLKKETYRWEEWKEMIRKELDAGYPLSYGGQSSGGGHAFVCDGYDAQGFFHINWGWGGYSNGFFALSVLDSNYGNDGYSDSQEMILNIRPSQTGDKKYVYKPVVTDISYSGSLPLTGNVGMSIGLRYTAFDNLDYYVGLAVVDVSGRIIQQPSDPKSMNFEAYVPGWRNYSTYRNITLSTSLGEGQRIAVVGSSDGHDWEVMRCLTTSPTGLDNDGLIGAPADNPDEPAVNPVNVSIYWNQFDDVFMAVSGLDNNQYNGQNTQGISYKLTNVTENVILRYTLKNYAAWKGQLDVYYGDNNSIYQPSQGTKAVIGEDGSFSVPVSLAQISEGAYVNYLKVLSAKQGELSYDIQVYLESDQANPIFEENDKPMRFMEALTGSIAPHPVMGAKNSRIPFTYTIEKTNQWLDGKPLGVSASISNLKADQIKLYYVSDGQEKEIPLKSGGNDYVYCYTEEDFAIGTLSGGASYTFKVEVNVLIDNASISLVPKVKDIYHPAGSAYAGLQITDTPVVTHAITTVLTNLIPREGLPTVIETGKNLYYKLECNKEGYTLPDMIQVEMGTKELNVITRPDELNAECTYNPETGEIMIYAVNGDVVITAAAVPVQIVTYPVKATLTNLSSSPAIVDATTVKEGETFSFTLSANNGYMLPASITIKMSGSTLEVGKGYTYDAKTGKVEILNVRGEVAITAEGVSEPSVYKIKADLKNLISTPAITTATTVKEGESFSFTLKAETNYRLPDAISILKGNDALTAEEFTYDAKTGKVVIKAVSGDLTVKASGIDDRHYEVILNLVGVTSQPASFDPVLVNGKVELTLKAAEGHTLPATVAVTMGGKTLVAGTDYTYNASTGAFSLAKITGKLSISAEGVKNSYPVTASLVNITSDIPTNATVKFGDEFACKLSANEGYTLPSEVTIVMDGKTLVDVTDYTYDVATGKISLKKVTGELAITAQGVQKSYAVALTLKDLTSDISQGKKIKHGETLTGKLSVVTPQYGLPSTIEVMMGGKVLAAGSGYSYDPKTGEIEIKNVTAEVSIKASGAEIFQVKEQTENIEIKTSGETVKEGEPFKCELAPATGYKFPYVIKVMMGGRLLKQKNLLRAAGSEYYTYDNTTGIIEIENVDGEIVIEAKGVQEGFFEVIPNLVNLTSDPVSFEPLAKDSKVELTLKAASGYTLPTSITVKMGENTLASTDYTYNSGTGAFALEKITATLVITAAGNRIPDPEPEPEPTPTTYMVTLPVVEGATLIAESSTNVESGKSFAFTLTLKDGYSAPQLTVKANGSVLGPVSSGRYVIEKVTSNIVVTVTGIVKDNPTDNAEVDPNGLRVWGENGRLHIQTPVMDTACIVTFEGRLYRNLSLPVGETITSIPQGSYIIYIGNQSYKIRF